ncbi:hypothetical protein COCCADRAFT_104376, partial [Bipolaris zeicola 26-R-13]
GGDEQRCGAWVECRELMTIDIMPFPPDPHHQENASEPGFLRRHYFSHKSMSIIYYQAEAISVLE